MYFDFHFRAKLHEEVANAEQTVAEKTQITNELHQQLRWANKHTTLTKGVTWVQYASMQPCSSLEPRLSIPDFVVQLWRTDLLQSCETKSRMENLGSRLALQ